ncbi:hypothetical protein [Nocardioides convexus]|uniref:hypothetical protein n=1 Tax=Nocardioides convexus TaxID=2712224 RepID=UPI0024183E0B|nr:hypothetical protein [Nocardioides convexus]
MAAVRDGEDAWTVEVAVPVLDEAARSGFVEAVAAESGRIAESARREPPARPRRARRGAWASSLLPYGGEPGRHLHLPALPRSVRPRGRGADPGRLAGRRRSAGAAGDPRPGPRGVAGRAAHPCRRHDR